MKREFLTELGLEGDQVDKIMAEHGKAVNSLKEEKDQAEQKAQEVDDLKQQIQDRDKQLEDLNKQAKGNEELQEQIQQLQSQNEQTQQDYEQKLEQQKKDFAIESALREENVHDASMAKSALDLDSIIVKDGKIHGLDDQVNDLKENKAFLFKKEENPGLSSRSPQPPKGNQPKGITKEQLNNMSYKERAQLYQEQPEIFEQ